MPIITLYRHGLTAGIPPGRNDHMRARRGDVGGWSNSSTRSNTRFLYSVNERELTGIGLGLTLTLRDCPEDHEEWHRIRRAFVHRLRRLGMVRMHWLTEWQRRGVPHLHAAVWFPESTAGDILPWKIKAHWLELTYAHRAGVRGQYISEITDSVGWFQYLSKHAVRGLGHYQRSPENVPAAWKKTGRMWGHLGEWPLREGIRIDLDMDGFYAFRRIVRSWRYADARATGDRRRMRAARVMLQGDETVSQMRGVSEWISEALQNQILVHLAAAGHTVES